jgi:DNA topoisomerase-3
MRLIISEKPSVMRTIAEVVGANTRKDGYNEGNGYIVSYCIGHLVGLAEPEEYGKQFAEKPWKVECLPIIPSKHGGWKFSVNKETKKQFEVLCKLMNRKDVTEIINGCDSGREGENIFRFVYSAANCSKKVMRLWIQSLESGAIRKGMNSLRPSSDFDNLYASGLCRARGDWLVGMSGTRALSAVYRTFLSVGRVQTPTLAMIAERDEKIRNFVKEKYFMVGLQFGDGSAILENAKFFDIAQAEKIKSDCNGKSAAVTAVKREKKTVNPPRLFDLTTLQREANRLYGYTAQNTLDFTQNLYEKHRCVSYPRTDSQYITEDMAGTVCDIIGIIFDKIPTYSGYSYVPNIGRIVDGSKVSDHYGIVPTAELANTDIDGLPDGERNILLLIVNKLLCATGAKHEYEAVTATVECGGSSFTARGKTVISDGWKAIERLFKGKELEEETTDNSLDLAENQTFNNVNCNIAEKWTSSPAHFTEDTLLSSMERANADESTVSGSLGTPATRAATIETIIRRGYVERKKKNLVCTEKGANLIKIVPESMRSPKLTAEWETALQKIAQGEYSEGEFMKQIENYTADIVAEVAANVNPENVTFGNGSGNVVGKCPRCGADVVENSKAYSCRERCLFVIWKTIAQKTITEAQAKKLLESGKSDKIKGFKSKAGKDFDAVLVVMKDFTVGFDFTRG